jgi:hypothetical protein
MEARMCFEFKHGLADISILSQTIVGKVSRIDGSSVTIILCLHVLIARRILLILDMLIIFSEYRCLKC